MNWRLKFPLRPTADIRRWGQRGNGVLPQNAEQTENVELKFDFFIKSDRFDVLTRKLHMFEIEQIYNFEYSRINKGICQIHRAALSRIKPVRIAM